MSSASSTSGPIANAPITGGQQPPAAATAPASVAPSSGGVTPVTQDVHDDRPVSAAPAGSALPHVALDNLDMGVTGASTVAPGPPPAPPVDPLHVILEKLELKEGTRLDDVKCAWLVDLRRREPAVFSAVFVVEGNTLRYRVPLEEAAVRSLREHFERGAVEGARNGFKKGMLATMLGALSLGFEPLRGPLELLGHSYDDFFKVVKHALVRGDGPRAVLFSEHDNKDARAEELEAKWNVELEPGRTMTEVGVLLATALGATALAEGPLRKALPYPLRTLLKAVGAYPFYNQIIHGDLVSAVKDRNLGDGVHQFLIALLCGVGLLQSKGWEQLASGLSMSAILSVIAGTTTNAVEKSVAATEKQLEFVRGLTARRVGENETTVEGVDPRELLVGEIIELRRGECVPADVHIVAFPDGQSEVLADTHLSSGNSSQRYAQGKQLDQGSVIHSDVRVHARVVRTYEKSAVVEQAEGRKHDATLREGKIEKIANGWVWGTLIGTVLLGLVEVNRMRAKELGIDWKHLLNKMICYATTSAPCNIEVSRMIYGATDRKLFPEGVAAINGNAIDQMVGIKKYFFDFTGTCTTGPRVVGTVLLDAEGRTVGAAESEALLKKVAAVGVAAGSQHPKQIGLRIYLQHVLNPLKAKRLAEQSVTGAVETDSSGVTGLYEGEPIRIGTARHVGLTAEQLEALPQTRDDDAEHSATYVRIGDRFGVIHYKDEVRADAKRALTRLGADRCYIISGDATNVAFIKQEAKKLGIPEDHLFIGKNKAEKAAIIEAHKKDGKVAMVGDGNNDLPALQAADVRIAPNDTSNDAILKELHYKVTDLAALVALEDLANKVNRLGMGSLFLAMGWTGLTSLAQFSERVKANVIGAAIAHEGMSGVIAFIHEWFSKHYITGFRKLRYELLGYDPAAASGVAA